MDNTDMLDALVEQYIAAHPELKDNRLLALEHVLASPEGQRWVHGEHAPPTTAKSMGALAYAAVCKLGSGVQARNPTLTEHGARDVVMKSATGRLLVELSKDTRTPEDFATAAAIVSKRVAATGCATWDATVAKLARDFAAARPDRDQHTAADNLAYGFALVQKQTPEVWAEYQRERGRA